MNYSETPEFQKEFKSFAKKWRTLPSDLKKAKRQIDLLYVPTDGIDIKVYRENFFGTKKATIISKNPSHEIVKMRLDCASPGSKNKLRLVFVYIKTKNGVTLVELFAKNHNQTRENPKRIEKFL